MITNTYNKGRFPNKMKMLQDIAAEEVAQKVVMVDGDIWGDPLLYAQAMTDPRARNSMLAARTRAFSDYSRRMEMLLNTCHSQAQMMRPLAELPVDATAEQMRTFRDRVNHMYSDEAIAHATGTGAPVQPSLLRIQTPRERLDIEHMPNVLPTTFVTFIEEQLGMGRTSQQKIVVADGIASRYDTTIDAAWTLLAQLWREWSKVHHQ